MFKDFFDIERVIHSFKTALACIIGALIIKLGNFQSGQWMMISIIIVMCAQINVGGVIQKSFLRFIGTSCGCLFALLALFSFGLNETSIIVTIAISSFIFSYIATYRDNLVNLGTLGAATTAIILTTPHTNITLATNRFIEISVGILIATLVSQFVLPIHARTHLLRLQAKTLNLFREFYLSCIATPPINAPVEFQETDEDIVKVISKQRLLSKEAEREPLGMFFDRHKFAQTLTCEKEILRAINFMHNALFHLQKNPEIFAQLAGVKYLNDTIPHAFTALVKVMENEDVTDVHFELPTVEDLTRSMGELYLQCPRNQALYLDGFLFSAEILINSLSTLANIFNLPIKSTFIPP